MTQASLARNGKILTWSHAILDGKVVATRKMEKTLPMILQWDELRHRLGHPHRRQRCGLQAAVPLTAKLEKLTIKMDRPKLTPADIAKLEEAQKAVADAN
jgi:hypothetical protein